MSDETPDAAPERVYTTLPLDIGGATQPAGTGLLVDSVTADDLVARGLDSLHPRMVHLTR